MRITLVGPELVGLETAEPAASVRVVFPSPAGADLEIPSWTGNEFLLADGRRPAIRTFTPVRAEPEAGELVIDVVRHGSEAAVASHWAAAAIVGDAIAVSGPGRGYAIGADDSSFLLLGDETAIPAIGQLLMMIPASASVTTVIETPAADARFELPGPHGDAVSWHLAAPGVVPGDELFAAVEAATLTPETRPSAAGEAASMQRIRRHLFEVRAWPRSQATVRGYWKRGRVGDDAD